MKTIYAAFTLLLALITSLTAQAVTLQPAPKLKAPSQLEKHNYLEKHSYQQVDITNEQDFSDLAALGEAIKGKRIVYLDELTHGADEVFALKSRIVKYLHQQHGFEALLLESGLYDVQQIWQAVDQADKTNSLVKQAPGNIFFGYANNAHFHGLLNYLAQHKNTTNAMALSGFDGRLSGVNSIDSVVNNIEKQSKKYLSAQAFSQIDWPAFNRLQQAIITGKKPELSKSEINQQIVQGYQLIDALAQANQVKETNQTQENAFDTPVYWSRLVAGILRSFENRYQLRRHDEHDLVMADNLAWLLEQVYPNKKVVIWGHYIHLNKLGAQIQRYDNAATLLNKKYADDSYFVHFAGIQGNYREFRDGSVIELPTLKANQFEKQLLPWFDGDVNSNSALFVDPATQPKLLNKDLVLFGHEYLPQHDIAIANWQQHFDAAFFIKQISALP